MKKALLILAAFGMIAASADAQTRRSRTRTTTTTKQNNTRAQNNDPNQNNTTVTPVYPNTGANGVDGTVNDRTTSGQNNSGAIIDQRSNNTVNDAPLTPAGTGTMGTGTIGTGTTR
jgi:hypothetical protein